MATTAEADRAPHTADHPPKLLAHLVLGYPTPAHSLQIAAGFAAGGAAALELQIPFSDPIADGPVIEHACHIALQSGLTVPQYIDLAAEIVRATALPAYCMAYATSPYRLGIPHFVHRIATAGMRGLIIPDLPFDSDEGLFRHCQRHAIAPVIVTTATIPDSRFRTIIALPHSTIYMALRGGITGQRTRLTPLALDRLHRLKQAGKRVIVGFGIETSRQIAALSPHIDYAAVGSHLVRAIDTLTRATPPPTTTDYRIAATKAVRTLLRP